jgi:hypothetical protein
MAQTPAAVQAVLGLNVMNATIVRAQEFDAIDTTHQQWFVIGNADAPGRERWCTTLASDTAANQAASILVTLRT